MAYGGNQRNYIKDVFNEQWDDYQIRSVAFGGNQPLFQIMKEYQVDNTPLDTKYRHACVNWYEKRHISQMDGFEFDLEANPMPPKNWDERIQQTQNTILKDLQFAKNNLSFVGSNLKEHGSIAGGVLKENSIAASAIAKEKADLLK